MRRIVRHAQHQIDGANALYAGLTRTRQRSRRSVRDDHQLQIRSTPAIRAVREGKRDGVVR